MLTNFDYLTTPNLFIKGKDNTFAYRELGRKKGIPLILLTHLSATLDNWDPQLMNTLAKNRWIIAFDNIGVGLSSGKVPTSIEKMADDALEFIHSLNLDQVDLLGLSMGGMVAQEMIFKESKLVRKLVLVGTGPRGGEGISNVTRVTIKDLIRSIFTQEDIKKYLFFTSTANGKKSSAEFLHRLNSRRDPKDKSIHFSSFRNQLKAINKWGKEPAADLSKFTQPTLVANGDNDRMVPTINSYDLAKLIPNAEIKIYPDSGHGSLFQFPNDFSLLVEDFLG